MRSAFYAAPESGERKIAYPNLLFDCNIIDGRAMLRSVLPPTIGNNQGMGEVRQDLNNLLPPLLTASVQGPAMQHYQQLAHPGSWHDRWRS